MHEVVEVARQCLVPDTQKFGVGDEADYHYLCLKVNKEKALALRGPDGETWRPESGEADVWFRPGDIQALADQMTG